MEITAQPETGRETENERKLQLQYLPISALVPYDRNPRTHSEEQVAQVADSIRQFGWTNPVLIDEQGSIIAGHGRVLAAQRLGIDKVPCIRLTELTDAQRRAYVIADNKLALNAGWDPLLLKLELGELREAEFDLALTGFSDAEFDALMFDGNFSPGGAAQQGRLDQKKKITCPHCGLDFEL